MGKNSTLGEENNGLLQEQHDMALLRKCFDVELIGNIAQIDMDGWQHEESLFARPRTRNLHIAAAQCSVNDSIEEATDDFRNHIDEKECECSQDEICIRCCTSADRLAIPDELIKKIENVRFEVFEGIRREVFDLRLDLRLFDRAIFS
jgi:hypothetical protein